MIPTVRNDSPASPFGVARLALLLGLFVCITFPGIVFGTEAFCYRDSGVQVYPFAYFCQQCLRHGELPLWNPYNNCGIPFLAQWNTMVLYPPALLCLLAPMPWAMNYFMLGHFFLAGAGMYYLARRWYRDDFAAIVAGLIFAWNGLSINLLIWPANIATLAWMPWVVLLCDIAAAQGGRSLFWAALAGTLQMMTGSPEIIFMTWLIALVLCARLWKPAWRFFVVVAWVSLMSAAQLAPTLDFIAHGNRSSTYDQGHWALPIWGVANFLVPLFRELPSIAGVYWQPGQELFSSYYAGILALPLALLALIEKRDRRMLLLAALGLGALWCAFGDAGGLWPLLKKIFPLLGFLRYPAKFVVLVLFCLPLLAGSGARWLLSRHKILLTFGMAGAGVLAVLIVARWFPGQGEDWSVTWHSGWTRLGILLAGCVVAFLLPRRRTPYGFLLLLLMGGDICTHEPPLIPTARADAYDPVAPPMSSLPQLGQSRAMVTGPANLVMEHVSNPSPFHLYRGQRAEEFKDCNLLDSIPKVDGFFSLYLGRQAQLAQLLSEKTYPTNLAQFLGVSEVTSPKQLFVWDAQTNFTPMATIGQRPIFLDDDETWKAISLPQFNPREMVYLPTEASSGLNATADPSAKIISSKVTASRCEFETESAHSTVLVVAQSWYHCWKADVDGLATPLLRANYGFQAVAVPAGRHEVRLIYNDRLFQFGSVISLAALAVGVLFRSRRA